MSPENNKSYPSIHRVAALVVVLVLIAGVSGWLLGRRGISSQSTKPFTSSTTSNPINKDAPGVSSLVSYVLPDGWKEASCSTSTGAVFAIPSGTANVDCNANPSSPVKISIDPSSSKDCNELQNVQNVKKHVCISLYINGRKSLRASTEYLASSTYGQATTINAYYIDTGKGVVKVEYVYNSDNQFQAGFDELVKSIKVKS